MENENLRNKRGNPGKGINFIGPVFVYGIITIAGLFVNILLFWIYLSNSNDSNVIVLFIGILPLTMTILVGYLFIQTVTEKYKYIWSYKGGYLDPNRGSAFHLSNIETENNKKGIAVFIGLIIIGLYLCLVGLALFLKSNVINSGDITLAIASIIIGSIILIINSIITFKRSKINREFKESEKLVEKHKDF